jgi:hypothetical protein
MFVQYRELCLCRCVGDVDSGPRTDRAFASACAVRKHSNAGQKLGPIRCPGKVPSNLVA